MPNIPVTMTTNAKPGRKPTGKVTVQIRLPERVRDELVSRAFAENESLSEYVEDALARAFRQRKAIK